MNPADIYLENELQRLLAIETTTGEDACKVQLVDTENPNANDILREQEDYILDELHKGNLKEVSVHSGDETYIDYNAAHLQKLVERKNELNLKLKALEKIENGLSGVEQLVENVHNLEEMVNNKISSSEKRLLEQFAKIDNTISKKQGKESELAPKMFDKLLPRFIKQPNTILQGKFKNLLSTKQKVLPARSHQFNNISYDHLRRIEGAMEKIRGMRVTSNPDQLVEEILLMLTKPVVGELKKSRDYKKAMMGIKIPKELESVRLPFDKKAEMSLIYNHKVYNFQGYTKDLKGIILGDPTNGKTYRLENNVNRALRPNTNIKLTEMQRDLLNNGSTLMVTNRVKHPYMIKHDALKPKYLNITTITQSEFKKQGQELSRQKQHNISHKL